MAELSAVERLRAEDLPRLLELAGYAGWNQTLPDLERMLRFAPDSCFGLWTESRLVSTAMAFHYGAELGWVAMVLTDPAARGRGFATMLTQHAVDWLRLQQVAWMKLDASPQGQPLYERLGFATESRMERHLLDAFLPRNQAHPAATLMELATGSEAADVNALPMTLDCEAFGADRSRLFGLLLRIPGLRVAVLPEGAGYAMLRPGAKAAQLGPMVCRDPEGAERLLGWALASTRGEPLQWDLDTTNSHALELARKNGFTPQRVLARMRLAGRPVAPAFGGDVRMVYAIGGFDFG